MTEYEQQSLQLLRRIAEAVERLEQRNVPAANVTPAELALLHAIADHTRNERGVPLEFSTSDLIEHAGKNVRLHDAIVEAHLEPSARKIGKLLQRIAGDTGSGTAGDLCIERLGQHRNGATWVIKAA